MFSTGVNGDDYVIVYDSKTASTNGEMFTIIVATTTETTGLSQARIITFPKPVQALKGIYVTNSAVSFKTTILYRPMR